MNRSVLEAIQSGDWTYEPEHGSAEFRATDAIPGSPEKLEILARRIQAGLPLWHPDDRTGPDFAVDHAKQLLNEVGSASLIAFEDSDVLIVAQEIDTLQDEVGDESSESL